MAWVKALWADGINPLVCTMKLDDRIARGMRPGFSSGSCIGGYRA